MTKNKISSASSRAGQALGTTLAVTAILSIAALPAPALGQTSTDSAPKLTVRPTDSTRISLTPARPKQGSILQIRIRPSTGEVTITDTARAATGRSDANTGGSDWTIPRVDSVHTDSAVVDSLRGRITGIRGTLFGEALHFVPGDSGTFVAIGGIPVDAPKTVQVPLIIERSAMASDTVRVRLDIARTAYRMEKLTVAPKFGQAPDSALAARLAREQKLAADVSRRSHEAPALWTSAFGRPRPSRVTSAFGDGREFNGTVQSRHMGLDLAGAVGTPVVAAGRGVVALVGEFYLAGNAVYLDHGGGLVTAYFHLSAVDVAAGDTVNAGDPIGKVGATGRVTGPHLHWVARYGSVTIDPSTLLDLSPAKREP